MPLCQSRLAALATTALLLAALAPPACAEVQKVMLQCEGELCPLFLPQLTAPTGWNADEEASQANKVSVLVPAGSDFHSAAAVIYARAYFNADKTTIQDRVETSNKKWLEIAKGAKIERLPDVARAKGAAFEVFHYVNPKNAQQEAEIIAFGEDTDKDGNAYGIQIVLTTTGEAALKKNQAAFMSLVKGY